MNINLFICLISLFGLLFAKGGKIYSVNLFNKISSSEKWPLDDWDMASLGLGYMARLSKEGALNKAKSSIVMANILFWCFFCACLFFGFMWIYKPL